MLRSCFGGMPKHTVALLHLHNVALASIHQHHGGATPPALPRILGAAKVPQGCAVQECAGSAPHSSLDALCQSLTVVRSAQNPAGDKYELFMVADLTDGEDPRGGPRVAFQASYGTF